MHPHADHVVGLPSALARFQVGVVLQPGCPTAAARPHTGLALCVGERSVTRRSVAPCGIAFAEASALIEEADAISVATGNPPLKYASLMLLGWRGQ